MYLSIFVLGFYWPSMPRPLVSDGAAGFIAARLNANQTAWGLTDTSHACERTALGVELGNLWRTRNVLSEVMGLF